MEEETATKKLSEALNYLAWFGEIVFDREEDKAAIQFSEEDKLKEDYSMAGWESLIDRLRHNDNNPIIY